MAADEVILEFSGVSLSFGSRVVLDQVDLIVRRGDMASVIGGSGSGKSTMLRLIMGLLRPDAGQIRIFGQDVGGLNERQWNKLRRNMAMVFQYSALFDFMNVADNVAFGLRQNSDLSEWEIRQRVDECLMAVGLSDAHNLYPSQLSGGMQKRVGLARAIAPRPHFIVYDEPTSGLDPVMTETIDDLIFRLNHQMKVTTLMVTHDLVSAYNITDRIIMLHGGRIVADEPDDTFRQSLVP
ncbi:MAG: ATP-binding cassette domain-containing protein [Negativicutes bacterium]|nr:ATP-binding cassette domain-containing protein [Negativicutes bacterium]